MVAKVIDLLGDSHSKDAVVTFEIMAGDKQSTITSSTMVDFSGRHKYEETMAAATGHMKDVSED